MALMDYQISHILFKARIIYFSFACFVLPALACLKVIFCLISDRSGALDRCPRWCEFIPIDYYML